MANLVAVLGVLIKAEGVGRTNKEVNTTNTALERTDETGKRASKRLRGIGRSGHVASGGLASAAKHAGALVAAYASIHGLEKAVSATEDLGHTTLTLGKSFGLTTKEAGRWAAVSKARGTEGKALVMGFKALATQTRNARQGLSAQGQALDALRTKQQQAIATAVKEGKSGKEIAKIRQGQTQTLDAAQKKSVTAAAAFEQLGIGQDDLAKHGGDLNWVLNRVSDGLAKLPPGTDKAAIMARLFGRTWVKTAPLIRDGSKAMNEQLAAADKYGATMGEKGVKSVEDMIVAQRDAKLASLGLQVVLGTTLIPVLSKVIQGAADFVRQFRAGQGAAGQLRDGINSVLAVLAPFGQSIQTIVHWLGEHEKVARILIPSLMGIAIAMWAVNAAMAANPFVLAAVALAALVVGIVTAYRTSQTFRAVVDAVFKALAAAFTWLQGAAGVMAQAVGGAFKWVSRAFTTATQAVLAEVRQWDVLLGFLRVVAKVMVAIFRAEFAVLRTVFNVGIAVLAPVAKAAWAAVQAVFKAVWAVLKGLVVGGLLAIRGVIKIIGALFKGDFGQAWDGVKDIFRGAIRVLKGYLDGAKALFGGAVRAIGTGMKAGFVSMWSGIKKIFRDSANSVIDFLNVIIRAINLIPGVPNIKMIGKIGGGDGGGAAQHNLGGTGHLARGGAFARTRGKVTRPITLMGEEAPRHPEYVIPTNPAYRKRAQGLASQAAQAVGLVGGGAYGDVVPEKRVGRRRPTAARTAGSVMNVARQFQQGGIYSIPEMGELWVRAGGAPGLADTMGKVAWAESHGNPHARNPSGATGLWQILGALVGGNLEDPMVNARNAVAKYAAQGLHAWDASRSVWEPMLSQSTADLGKIIGAVAQALNPMQFINKLPNPADMLPDWLQGTGKYVVGKAEKWIRDKVATIFTGGGGAGGPSGTESFDGKPVAKWIIPELQWAREHGWSGQVTSGWRDPRQVVHGQFATAKQGQSEHQGIQYPHGAVDVSDYQNFASIIRGYRGRFKLIQLGIDPLHFSGTGHAEGGIFGMKAGAVHRPTPKVPRAIAGQRQLDVPARGARVSLSTRMRKTLDAVRNAKGKHPGRIRGQAMHLMRAAIQDVDISEGIKRALVDLPAKADIYADYAERAGALTDTDKIQAALEQEMTRRKAAGQTFPDADQMAMVDSMLGRVDGRAQAEWLSDQLAVLFRWRNRIIAALEAVAAARKRVQDLLDKARTQLAKVQKEMDDAGDEKHSLNARLRELNKHPRQNRAKIRKVKDRIAAIDKAQAARQHVKDALTGENGIIKASQARIGKFREARATMKTNLDDVQGVGSPMNKESVLPEVGVLGGKIFEVQMALQDAQGSRDQLRVTDDAADAAPTVDDKSARLAELLQGLLDEANRRNLVLAAQYNVLRDTPAIPFGGAFASGGMVPGPPGQPTMILAHGGETVVPGNATSEVHLHFAPGTEWLRDFVKVQVEGTTRRQARTRGLPGSPGSLR